jgi:hypothetical protein
VTELEKDIVEPREVVTRATPTPLQSDVWVYRMVVFSLGLTVLLALIGAVVIAIMGKTTPEVLVALGSAAIGALAGLLVPSPPSK